MPSPRRALLLAGLALLLPAPAAEAAATVSFDRDRNVLTVQGTGTEADNITITETSTHHVVTSAVPNGLTSFDPHCEPQSAGATSVTCPVADPNDPGTPRPA